MSLEHSNYVYRETEASESFAQDYPPSQPKLEPNHSTISTSIGSSPAMVKKLHHNARERDRCKKIMEKLSIPATVSRMVKYIPELQQQVDILIQKKEELISRICRQGEQIHQENQRQIASRSFLSAVSASWLNDREVMIQISTYKVHKSPLAEILPNLEKDGFLILNASSFESFGGRVFYNLHLQAESTYALKREVLSEKLLSFS
ncbi:hypothetical protein ACB098_06G054900 [Castanea mollissima]